MSAFVLHLLRHGEPVGAGRLLGHSDARPRAESIGACAERVSGLAFDQVIASDLSRAMTPAMAIASVRGMVLRSDPRWRELNFGLWEGADPAEIPPAQLGAFWGDPQGCPPPGGESWQAICYRVEAALADIDRPTLVVTHAGAIRAALACLFGWDHHQIWALALPYAACVSLTVWPDGQRAAQITGLAT